MVECKWVKENGVLFSLLGVYLATNEPIDSTPDQIIDKYEKGNIPHLFRRMLCIIYTDYNLRIGKFEIILRAADDSVWQQS